MSGNNFGSFMSGAMGGYSAGRGIGDAFKQKVEQPTTGGAPTPGAATPGGAPAADTSSGKDGSWSFLSGLIGGGSADLPVKTLGSGLAGGKGLGLGLINKLTGN